MIVADTNIVSTFARVGALSLLKRLLEADRLHITSGTYHELRRAVEVGHLYGLALVDGRPKYVTALGETDTAGGWRANKPQGGCLMEASSGERISRGLSMPHSPRWHDGRLWLLESGTGQLVLVDPDTGPIGTELA